MRLSRLWVKNCRFSRARNDRCRNCVIRFATNFRLCSRRTFASSARSKFKPPPRHSLQTPIRISISVSGGASEESCIFSTLGFTFVWEAKQVSSKSLLCFLVELQNREITLLFFRQSKSLSLFNKKKTFLFHKVRKKKKKLVCFLRLSMFQFACFAISECQWPQSNRSRWMEEWKGRENF